MTQETLVPDDQPEELNRSTFTENGCAQRLDKPPRRAIPARGAVLSMAFSSNLPRPTLAPAPENVLALGAKALVNDRMAKKILFVDDDAQWRDVVSTTLQDGGFEVIVAKDATEAMHFSEGTQIGLIILDLNLAGENGIVLMKYLKRNQPYAPIILYSGMDHDDAAVRTMLEQGADQYLQKGAMAELLLTVGGYFRHLDPKTPPGQTKKPGPTP
jgi:CheY-like chemotaxis protein